MNMTLDGKFSAAREIDLALQVLNAIVPDGEGAYLAGPISTGRRYYEALAKYQVNDMDELVAKLGEEPYLHCVRWPNVEDGERRAAELRVSGVRYLINTGPIFVRGWRGRDYMEFCLKLLVKKVSSVYFHPEWVYSHGAIQEYLFCRDRDRTVVGRPIKTLDLAGSPIVEDDARRSLLAAKCHIEQLGLNTSKLEGYISQLQSMANE